MPAPCRRRARSASRRVAGRHARRLPLRGHRHRPARPLRARHDEEEGAKPGRRVRRQPAAGAGPSAAGGGRDAPESAAAPPADRRRRCAGHAGDGAASPGGALRAVAARAASAAAVAGTRMTAVPQGMLWPRTVDEATAMLAATIPTPRPLAGGATLVAMMNARVARAAGARQPVAHRRAARHPQRGRRRRAHRRLHAPRRDGRLRPAARHRAASCARPPRRSPTRPSATWARSAARSRSPIPGLDYPPALVAAGAVDRDRRVRAGAAGSPRADFFVDWYTTALEPGEIVTAVLLPRAQPGGAAYVKHARVAGDYATASAAVCIDADGRGPGGDRLLRPDADRATTTPTRC